MRGAIVNQSLQADIVLGGRAGRDDLKLNGVVLEFTLRQSLLTRSYFTDSSGPRYDEQATATQLAEIEGQCQTVRSGLNALWFLSRVTHNCLGILHGGAVL